MNRESKVAARSGLTAPEWAMIVAAVVAIITFPTGLFLTVPLALFLIVTSAVMQISRRGRRWIQALSCTGALLAIAWMVISLDVNL